MPTIIKKIPLLLLLCGFTCVLKAQVVSPAATAPVVHTAPQRIMPAYRTYASYQEEFNQRFPSAGINARGHTTGMNADRLPTKRSYAMISREMEAKYPVLQRNMLSRPAMAHELQLLPVQRPFSYYQQQAAIRISLASQQSKARNL